MLLPRQRSLSLRARLTLIATGAAAFFLIPLAVVVNVAVRHAVADRIWDASLATATRVAAEVRDGHLPSPVPTNANGIDLVEVVAPDGSVVAGSPAARGLRPLSPLRPSSDTHVTQTTTCAMPHRDCVFVTAIRVSPRPDSVVVYAGRSAPAILTTPIPALELLVFAALLAALSGWIAWRGTGRALRPVEAMRSELAEITPKNTASRLPQPPGNDEIARLARTANDALTRLDESIQKQRRFAADASHELLTPIAGIRAQLEGARLHPEDTCEALDAALRDTERLEGIVGDLLLLARIGTVPEAVREEVDLGRLVADEAERRDRREGREGPRRDRLPTHVEIEPGVWIMGLRGQLRRVVTNLLDNAERHAVTAVSVEVTRRDHDAVLCVVNDGDPIPEGDRERIFERFYRRDAARSRVHGGSGLGLAIAREVVEAHDGTIAVEDGEPGVRFVIRLPLAEPHEVTPGA
ncbi:ATP-binding protein [Microbispora sp. NPDC049125]|uniref:HAMP domain-containing sensor histidine kinase n=1 Tax=Microbispora sp. NPDC049125 TaxID=3154929 RepID=UPI0034660CB4